MKKEICKTIYKNILTLCIIEIFFFFLTLGYRNIEPKVLATDLFVFSGLGIFLTIYFFEKAYSKDSGFLALLGIEVMVVSLITLSLPYCYYCFEEPIKSLDKLSMLFFLIYYIVKCLIIFFTCTIKKQKGQVK